MQISDRWMIPLAFGATYIIWGSTYLFNKILVEELTPMLIAGTRFTIAGAAILLIAKMIGQLKKITNAQLKNTIWAGFFFLAFGNGLAVWSMQYLDSGLTAILVSAQPMVLLVMLWAMEGQQILPKSIIGVALGSLGIYLLIGQNDIAHHPEQWKGLLGIATCLLSWGYGSIFVAKADLPKNALINSGYQMLSAGVMLMAGAAIYGDDFNKIVTLSAKGWWSMVILIIFGSIIAFTAFNFLLKKTSPEKVATNTYVNPIVAMFLGAVVLGEQITWLAIIASIVLLSGVYFINSSKAKKLEEN